MDIKIINEGCMPTRASEEAIAWDVYFAQDYILLPGEIFKMPLGFALDLGSEDIPGLGARLQPRSSNKTLALTNGVGLIDTDYLGQYMASIRNVSGETQMLYKGDRYFQMTIERFIVEVDFYKVDEFHRDTERGVGGFGSTNK